MKALLPLLFVLFISTSNSQTLIRWDFERGDGTPTLFPTFISDTSVMDVNDVRYSSLYPLDGNPVPGVSGQPFDWANSVRGWYPDSSIHTYIWTWVEFRFFVDSGVTAKVDSVSLWCRRDDVGPTRFDFRSHKDLYASAIDAILLDESDVSWHKWSIPVSPFIVNGYEQVTFRIYGDGAPSHHEGYFFKDSVAIFGSVVYADTLHLRAMLSGPFDESTGMMHDSLRLKGFVPLIDPYGYGKTISQSVLDVSGANGVVDWVNVGIRSPSNPSLVLDSFPALIQRDGDIVGLGGVSAPTVFTSEDSAYISVQHRNHLGVMTSVPVSLSDTVNFHLFSTSVFGVDARKQVGSNALLWDGDVDHDNSIRYVGQSNDRDFILQGVGGTVPTNAVSGYFDFDVNMDGVVRYTGQDNDRDPILLNIGGSVPTNTKVGSVP